jgi:hypothetical protein
MTLRGKNCSRMALGLVLALGLPMIAGAQPGPNGPPPYTPAANAKDLKSVLFNWGWHMVQLRGLDEHELAVSLEYTGKGTLQVDGQPCTLTKYRSSSNYQVSGQRIQYTCTRANGQAYSNIEVVSGQYAWNEDIPGAEIVAGKGKATPMPNAVQERLIRLWAGPQAALKAALAGAGIPVLATDRNPGQLLAGGTSKLGETSVAWKGGKPVVTFPLPGVEGATAVATLDSKHFWPESVVVTQGSTTTAFTYADYKDWNNPLNPIEAQYAGKITEKRNGQTVRDLTTVQTETGSVYVVVPVPDSVRSAIPAKASGPDLLTGVDRQVKLESKDPTPRTAAGTPDLSGNWFAGGMNWRYGNRRCAPEQLAGCSEAWNQTLDFEFEAPSRFGPNRPLYKPELWDKVQELDMWTNKYDPVMTCQPLGIPRHGAPRRIVQNKDDIIFFYGQYADGGGGQGEYRIMPTDGRQHDLKKRETTYMGSTVGRWEGDTLVLDSIGFNDFTWLARGGFFHSEDMHVVERFTRQGNEILYEVTIEDPEVLVKPWVMTPRILRPAPFPDAGLLPERGNCEVYEQEDVATQIRH